MRMHMTLKQSSRLHLVSFAIVATALFLAFGSGEAIQDLATAREYPKRGCKPVGSSVFQYFITVVVEEQNKAGDYLPVEGASVRIEYKIFDAVSESADSCSVEPAIVSSEILNTDGDGRVLLVTPSVIWDDQNEKVSIRATATKSGFTTNIGSGAINYANRSNTSEVINLIITNEVWAQE